MTINGISTAISLVFWNVQDLFDPGVTARGPQTEDELQAKIGVLATILDGIGEGTGPQIIGLAEIGSERILQALTQRLTGRYRRFWLAPGAPGNTGLACLLCRDTFVQAELVAFERVARARVMVLRCGLEGLDEPVWLAVNHWKSRWPTAPENDREERLRTARWLARRLADEEADACAVICGDFNDEPADASLGPPGLNGSPDLNLVSRRPGGLGFFNAVASRRDAGVPLGGARPALPPKLFDQLLVSRRALHDGPLMLDPNTVHYLCTDRTATPTGAPLAWAWRADGSHRGASDHLPLIAAFAKGRRGPPARSAGYRRSPSAEVVPPLPALHALVGEVAAGLRAQAPQLAATLRVAMEPGYETLSGRQYLVIVSLTGRCFRDVFLRVYVPAGDWPLQLDWYQGLVACGSADELLAQTRRFLSLPETARRLRSLVAVVAEPHGLTEVPPAPAAGGSLQ